MAQEIVNLEPDFDELKLMEEQVQSQLFFVELRGDGQDPDNQFPDAYERIEVSLLKRGWSMLKWPTEIVFTEDEWYDVCHPKPQVVAELISKLITVMITDNPKIRSILVIGDSTVAYCTDKKRDISYRDLVQLIISRPEFTEFEQEIDVYITSISGSSFTSSAWNFCTKKYNKTTFIVQIEHGIKGGYHYDAILLIGGWNQKNILDDHIFDQFHQIALDALR